MIMVWLMPRKERKIKTNRRIRFPGAGVLEPVVVRVGLPGPGLVILERDEADGREAHGQQDAAEEAPAVELATSGIGRRS